MWIFNSGVKFQYETDLAFGIQQPVYNSQDQAKVLFSSPDLTFWTISNNNNNGRKDSREDSRVVNFILRILCQTPKQFYEAIKYCSSIIIWKHSSRLTHFTVNSNISLKSTEFTFHKLIKSMWLVVTCVSRGFIKWRYNAQHVISSTFQFHSIPSGEDFYKQAVSLNISTFLNLPGLGVSWNVFTGAGSRRCSVALLSIFYQERARKHFSIRDEAPLEPELASVNTIYSRDPEYILALLHTSSPIKTLPSKTKCW